MRINRTFVSRRLAGVVSAVAIGITSMWVGGSAPTASASDVSGVIIDIGDELLDVVPEEGIDLRQWVRYFGTNFEFDIDIGGETVSVDIDLDKLGGFRIHSVESGGNKFAAFTFEPAGPGPHPIILMPAPWNAPGIAYGLQAAKFAEAGFLVVAYEAPGFWFSRGEVDVAGQPAIDQVSDLIDWAVSNKNGDEERVGTAGISYGAGIGLLSIAEEPRLDAVISMSGWADFEESFYPNETIHQQGANDIFDNTFTDGGQGVPQPTANPGQVLYDMRAEAADGVATTALAIAPSRSAANDIDAINNSDVAVMISHAYNDTGFPAGQMVDFFTELTVPKKLILQPGVHFRAEESGLFGQPNLAWDEALQFAKRHVMKDTSIDTGYVVTAFDHDDSGRIAYGDSWEQITANTVEDLYLTEPDGWIREQGDLGSDPSVGWDEKLYPGSTTADSLDREDLRDRVENSYSHMVFIPGIRRTYGAVWRSSAMPETRQLSGSPEVTFTVEPREETFTVFAYLYEEMRYTGFGKLISHKPITVRGGASGQAATIDLELEPIVWEVNEGNRLVLVIDTQDLNYESETDERLYIVSSSENPAVLRVPWR